MLITLDWKILIRRLPLSFLRFLAFRFSVFLALFVYDARSDFLLPAGIPVLLFELCFQLCVFLLPFWTGSSWHNIPFSFKLSPAKQPFL